MATALALLAARALAIAPRMDVQDVSQIISALPNLCGARHNSATGIRPFDGKALLHVMVQRMDKRWTKPQHVASVIWTSTLLRYSLHPDIGFRCAVALKDWFNAGVVFFPQDMGMILEPLTCCESSLDWELLLVRHSLQSVSLAIRAVIKLGVLSALRSRSGANAHFLFLRSTVATMIWADRFSADDVQVLCAAVSRIISQGHMSLRNQCTVAVAIAAAAVPFAPAGDLLSLVIESVRRAGDDEKRNPVVVTAMLRVFTSLSDGAHQAIAHRAMNALLCGSDFRRFPVLASDLVFRLLDNKSCSGHHRQLIDASVAARLREPVMDTALCFALINRGLCVELEFPVAVQALREHVQTVLESVNVETIHPVHMLQAMGVLQHDGSKAMRMILLRRLQRSLDGVQLLEQMLFLARISTQVASSFLRDSFVPDAELGGEVCAFEGAPIERCLVLLETIAQLLQPSEELKEQISQHCTHLQVQHLVQLARELPEQV